MKKTILLLFAALLTAGLVDAQRDALDNFIGQHRHDDAFTFAYLSKDLFEVVAHSGIEDKDWQQLHSIVKNIGSLSILASDSVANGQALYREALRLVPNDEFDELLTVHDGETNVRIWSRDEGDLVTDLVLLVGSSAAFALVCFSGNLELVNISELARLLDAGEAEHLVRATEAVALDFSISPNPNNGEFTVSCAGENDLPEFLSVTDQNGRQLSSLHLSGDAAQQVALRDLPSGLYWLQLKSRSGKIGVKQLQIAKKQ